jgi:homoserine dehydrogenase
MVYIAIIGFGNIGSGVAELLTANSAKIADALGDTVELKYILDLNVPLGSPYEKYFTTDFSVIENDPEVRIVVETIGGAGAAYDFTKRSLQKGKSVVTSNKELVATHGAELVSIARDTNSNYLFEASVGGGIPVLRPLAQCLQANEIEEVYGILNGTTNYILTKMRSDGIRFEDALKQAQEKGYAEPNPESDISGRDTARKICILAAMAFGRLLDPDKIPVKGIQNITLDEVLEAEKQGGSVKLIGRAAKLPNGQIGISVEPVAISRDNLLSDVNDVFNGIVVRGNAVGEVLFYGRGAGKLPTASAVIADVIDAAKHFHARKRIYFEDGRNDEIGKLPEWGGGKL